MILSLNSYKKQFADLIEEMKELYLKDAVPWCLLSSKGKDSTLMLTLVWQMLASLPVDKRHKVVNVVTSDTMVEVPSMTAYVHESLARIQQAAEEQNLPIQCHLAQPEMKNRYWFQVLGKGNPPPTKKSPFRWCTSKLKINATGRVIEKLIGEVEENKAFSNTQHSVLMLLGVREAESESRKASIKKHALEDKFARHAQYANALVYHPIRYVETPDLWAYLMDLGTLPWGIDTTELYSMYRNTSGECPMTAVDGKQTATCGGSRFGCWTCVYVSEDKMLINLIESGDDTLIPMLRFKNHLLNIRNDIRCRMTIRRNEYKAVEKRLSQPEPLQVNIFDLTGEENELQLAENWAFAPGSINIQTRKKLLQYLLFTEQASGHKLIQEDELQAIIDCWISEGYKVTTEDLVPCEWVHEGSIVLNPDGSVNLKETTYTGAIFPVWEDFLFDRDEIIEFLRERELFTGKHIFYFMTSTQYGSRADDLVANNVQFIVAEPHIHTFEQAQAYLEEWLGYNEPLDEQMDWKAFGERLLLQASMYALEPEHDPEILRRLNTTLGTLGIGTVQPVLSASTQKDGQLQLII